MSKTLYRSGQKLKRVVGYQKSLAIMGVAILGIAAFGVVSLRAGAATGTEYYVCPDSGTPCTGSDTTDHTGQENVYTKIQDALDAAGVAGEPATVWVQKGQTFTENLVIKSDHLKLRGAEPGGPGNPATPDESTIYTDNSGPWGVEVSDKNDVEIRFLNFAVGQGETKLAFHLKIYNSKDIYMRHTDFTGPGMDSSLKVTGLDFNSTSNVQLVQNTAKNYSKNGIAVTAKYAPGNTASKNYSFEGNTASDNGWNGLAFYTYSLNVPVQSANITKVTFNDYNQTVNQFRNNKLSGISVQGASDGALPFLSAPDKRVSSTTNANSPLDVSKVRFSGNFWFDISNYQTNDVTASNAYFQPYGLATDTLGSTVGSVPAWRAAQENKFFDKLDSSNLGKVQF